MDGYDNCKLLTTNSILNEVPEIYNRVQIKPLEKEKAFSVGGIEYITFPFQPEVERLRLENHIRHSRP
jgi:two-component system, sensor histidine kinase and response regulator